MSPGRLGRPHRHYAITESTNDRARELALGGAPSGTVVTADEQLGGRGRRGRSWSAPAGKALLYSAILRPLGPEHALLPIAAPIAVCEAIEAIAPVRCAIKWPNDVWLEESAAKLAGVLIEARHPEWAVIGIGINLAIEPDEFPPDLRWPAASVGHGASRAAALAALNERLASWVEAPATRMLAAYGERDALRGRPVEWEALGSRDAGRGTAAGIDEQGNLLVVGPGGETESLRSGEVTLSAF